MVRAHRVSFVLVVIAFVSFAVRPHAAPGAAPTIEQFLSPAYPQDLVSAKKSDAIAWWAYERGQRNVYAAAAPAFRPVRLTNFTKDDGIDISDVNISDDGSTVVFVRGSQPNREGWVADPASDPSGADRTIWAARTSGGGAWKLTEGTTPVLSPDGRTVVFARDGQIYSIAVARPAQARDQGAAPQSARLLIKAWGANYAPKWSPDGTKVAFTSNRVDHSFVGVYDLRAKTLTFLSPSVDHDTSPTWSPDGRRVAFIRRPGTPFAQQAHQGAGSIGNPDGPAYKADQWVRRFGDKSGLPRFEGQFGRRGGEESREPQRPGLTTATFSGGYTLSFWVADAASGEANEFWHNEPGDKQFANVNAIAWAGADHVVFGAEPEEWARYFSVSVSGATKAPIVLTPGDGAVDANEGIPLSKDGKYLFYCTNAGDIERRHIWKVPTAGGTAEAVTKGDTIETYAAALASGSRVALLRADATHPQSLGIVAASGGEVKTIFPVLPKEFPLTSEVAPQLVITKAADGMEIHNQIFVPAGIKPGEKRPAIVFVHGGPIRQMLLGYHYMHFYHIAYAVNQWLASQGYIVMSVNYRSGIGYGKSFRMAPNTGGRGNAEYQDVVAGGKYLQSRAEVDPERIGIWGLSYGGVLTSQALARNSDIFKVGVDMAGVHLWGSSLDPANVSYQSSTIGAIDGWKSPVLLVHGDDDRNVQFSQTTGLVQLLRAHHVPYEVIVYPDDTHETLLHMRWINTFNRLDEFLGRYLKAGAGKRTSAGQ